MRNSANFESIHQRLAHVYWIGGSPCSGKSSIVEWLAERHTFTSYRCDDGFWERGQRARPEAQPDLHRVVRMSWDEIWMRPVDVLLEDEIAIYGQEFGMILDELLALPDDVPVVAEGAVLMPHLVHDLLTDPRQAIWVVPGEAFQHALYPKRGEWVQGILRQCSDPERAFRNWMDRDAAFARRVAKEASARGLKVLEVDGQRPIEENARIVEAHFGLMGKSANSRP